MRTFCGTGTPGHGDAQRHRLPHPSSPIEVRVFAGTPGHRDGQPQSAQFYYPAD